MFVFPSGDSTTAPLIYANGVDISSNFTFTANGTPPNWMPASLATAYYRQHFTAPPGCRFIPHAPILGALTAAEVLDWTNTGRLPVWCEIGTGSMIAAYASDFSSTNDSWTQNGGVTRTPNIDTNADGAGYPPSNDWLRFINSSGSSGLCIPQRAVLTSGKKYIVSVDILLTASAGVSFVAVGLTGTGIGANPSKFMAAVTPGIVATITGIINAVNSGGIQITPCTDLAGSSETSVPNGQGLYIKNVVVRELGPLFKPVIQPIAVIADLGSNKIAGILSPGISPVTEKRDWLIQGATATNGNQQLLGASVFTDNTKVAFDSIEDNGSGTPTVGIGSASGGAQYVAAAAVLAGRNRRTPVTPFPGTNNIWVSCTDANPRQHTIRGHMID
jgi:hypothetical protein